MSNVELIKGLYQSFAAGDIESVLALFDPQILWIESDGLPYSGTFVGPEAIVQGVFGKIGAEWDNFSARVDEFIDAGDQVVTLGADSGTFKATGKSMSAPAASVWTLRDGKIVKFVQYIDTLKVASAVHHGAIPAEPARG